MVVPTSVGGLVDSSMSGFADALRQAFQSPHIPAHFEKLANAAADQRHLFIPLHDSALPPGITLELMTGDALPSKPPPVPHSITHLWLAPAFSKRVLLCSRPEGWRNIYPYNK
jgi:hypothetical protein